MGKKVKKKKLFVQCYLEFKNTHQIVWLNYDKRLRVGSSVSLKDSIDPTKFWFVKSISKPQEIPDRNSANWFDTDFIRKKDGSLISKEFSR